MYGVIPVTKIEILQIGVKLIRNNSDYVSSGLYIGNMAGNIQTVIGSDRFSAF